MVSFKSYKLSTFLYELHDILHLFKNRKKIELVSEEKKHEKQLFDNGNN